MTLITIASRSTRSAPVRCLSILLCSLVVACSDPIAVSEGDVRVVSENGALRVENHSKAFDLAIAIFDVRQSPLLDLVSCDQWEDLILPGLERRIPHEELWGFDANSEAMEVRWCFRDDTRVVAGGSLRVDLDR